MIGGMPEAIELHDSILGAVVRDGTDLIVRFTPAYVHRSEGLPGHDPGSGWSAEVTMRIGNGAARPVGVTLPAAISDGTVTLGDRTLSNLVPLPLRAGDRVRMVLMLASGEELELTGSSFDCAVSGPSTYVEEFR